MATRIDVNSNATLTGTFITVDVSGVQAGDVIVLGVSAVSVGTTISRQCTDDLGNTYTLAIQSEPGNGSGFGFSFAYVSVADFGGDPEIRYEDSVNDGRFATAVVVRDCGILDRVAQHEGIVEEDGGLGRSTLQSSPMIYADSYTLSFLVTYSADATPPTNPSPSGEDLINTQNLLTSYQFCFEQIRTTPTAQAERVLLQYFTHNFNSIAMVCLTFTKPFARPVDFVKQSALQPGVGFDDNESDFPINRPITCSLPYKVEIGDTIFVGGAWFSDVEASISDEYGGNVYSVRATSVAPSADTGTVRWWSTTVVFPPPIDEPFRVTISPAIPGTGQPYQCSALGLYAIARTPIAYEGFEFDDYVDLDPIVQIRTTEAVAVPVNTLLLVFAAYGVGVNQTAATWANNNGFVLQSSSDIIQTTLQAGVINADRFAPAAIYDQTVAVQGNFRGIGQAEITGAFNAAGSVVMLAVTLGATITLVKTVTGGQATPSQFTLTATGPTVVTGPGPTVGPTAVDAGEYTLSETGPSGYVAGAWGIVGGTQTGLASFEIADGESVVATINNSAQSGCDGAPEEDTDVYFELRRIYATMKPHKRIPVRGGS